MINALGIVVPAHDEEELLPSCLAALSRAARAVTALRGISVRTVVTADACSDDTAAIARRAGTTVVEIGARNVGVARAAGLREILRRSRPGGPRGLWLTTTDADSVVPPHWLSEQVRYADDGWEAVVGTVAVADWTGHTPATASEFARQYGVWRGWHPHVHGANLGFSAQAYLAAGGFPPLRTAEDHALVSALRAQGRRVLHTPELRVVTSARTRYRAPGGFGCRLTTLGGGPGPLLGAWGGDGHV
ncbi:MAG TPA: glycosyltransferase [Streptosporangiaceae bacterium]|jgi:cellulose synthase/poly-beta-1,6-N-acetylglucosamine synthase-like glycosyltransferase|nr:glycosyltransferase [Streptosporangiaceae bacterium]